MNYIKNLKEKDKIKIYLSSKKVYQNFFDLNKIVDDLFKYIKHINKKNVKKNIL